MSDLTAPLRALAARGAKARHARGLPVGRPCHGCALRQGTEASTELLAVRNLEAAMLEEERGRFACHEHTRAGVPPDEAPLCGGFVNLMSFCGTDLDA